MSAISLLSSSLNRRDEEPNEALASEIIQSKRTKWVQELVEHLGDKDKAIQHDCIKVLYEIGQQGAPELIAPYAKTFGEFLKSKNNRLVWGAMTALDSIALYAPKELIELLPAILYGIEIGSVITIDGGVSILAKLASFPEYADQAFPLLMEQLQQCPPKQLPMYAEKSMIAIRSENKKPFLELLESRLPDLEKDSQRKRIDKLIKKLK